jgi:hypothetical protein
VKWGPAINAGLTSLIDSIKGFLDKLGILKGNSQGLQMSPFGLSPMSYEGGGSFNDGMLYSGGGGGAGVKNLGVNHAPPNFGGGGLGPLSPISGHLPASIRYNNPGAQWPRAGDARFGAIGYGKLADGNLIERFPDPASGVAANLSLFATKYTGMRLGAAGARWTGGHGFGVPGYDPNMVVTREMMNDPNFAIPLMKAIAGREAGHRSPLTDEQWAHGYSMFQHGGVSAAIPGPSAKEIHIHNSHILDGRIIAKSTMKHIITHGNMPASGGRETDIYATRPMSI